MAPVRCQQESILLLGCAVPAGDSTVCGSARERPGAAQGLYRLQGCRPGGLCRATTLEESTGDGGGGGLGGNAGHPLLKNRNMIAWIYSGSVGRSSETTGGENQMVGGKTCLEWK